MPFQVRLTASLCCWYSLFDVVVDEEDDEMETDDEQEREEEDDEKEQESEEEIEYVEDFNESDADDIEDLDNDEDMLEVLAPSKTKRSLEIEYEPVTQSKSKERVKQRSKVASNGK